ncbi:MAG: recombinase family protein [Lachnospiraceae bacterium]|nr:recombinase family protein [Lachnospiraceae bacterium]
MKNEEQAEVARQIFSEYISGRPSTAIARDLRSNKFYSSI